MAKNVRKYIGKREKSPGKTEYRWAIDFRNMKKLPPRQKKKKKK
jgi:hypothetical protein